MGNQQGSNSPSECLNLQEFRIINLLQNNFFPKIVFDRITGWTGLVLIYPVHPVILSNFFFAYLNFLLHNHAKFTLSTISCALKTSLVNQYHGCRAFILNSVSWLLYSFVSFYPHDFPKRHYIKTFYYDCIFWVLLLLLCSINHLEKQNLI